MNMKIKWKYVCAVCLAPLDPYFKVSHAWELRLFDKYLHETNPPFKNNNSHSWKNTRVCTCCYERGSIKFNPRINTLRQIGAIRSIVPKTKSVSRDEMKLWVKNFYKILEENKPK